MVAVVEFAIELVVVEALFACSLALAPERVAAPPVVSVSVELAGPVADSFVLCLYLRSADHLPPPLLVSPVHVAVGTSTVA